MSKDFLKKIKVWRIFLLAKSTIQPEPIFILYIEFYKHSYEQVLFNMHALCGPSWHDRTTTDF